MVDPAISEWKGARLIHLPTIRNKYLDTFVHTFLSAVHAGFVLKPDALWRTLPTLLARAGYRTHLFGFQHEAADPHTPTSWMRPGARRSRCWPATRRKSPRT